VSSTKQFALARHLGLDQPIALALTKVIDDVIGDARQSGSPQAATPWSRLELRPLLTDAVETLLQQHRPFSALTCCLRGLGLKIRKVDVSHGSFRIDKP